MSEKIYRVQINSKGMPNFSTAVEVADRPQGEWIDIDPRLNRRRVNKYKQCSRCGFSWARPFDDNFCPHCGARMKGAEDEGPNRERRNDKPNR